MERGAVERGAVERGAVERGAVERGAVENGAVEIEVRGAARTGEGGRLCRARVECKVPLPEQRFMQ
ncbi:uncharacterized protein CMC5_064100 [Chondromyces crocatus]|uniref:Uncharacterized protein n=1 Tax=Chondromyces crocatus TaxID=52 RepID=A0A0K1ENH3_CHOCO|nr:uncharacterized protein CMC5_064100 [Chondromyces crocatus]